jgi:hypothetical protein
MQLYNTLPSSVALYCIWVTPDCPIACVSSFTAAVDCLLSSRNWRWHLQISSLLFAYRSLSLCLWPSLGSAYTSSHFSISDNNDGTEYCLCCELPWFFLLVISWTGVFLEDDIPICSLIYIFSSKIKWYRYFSSKIKRYRYCLTTEPEEILVCKSHCYKNIPSYKRQSR